MTNGGRQHEMFELIVGTTMEFCRVYQITVRLFLDNNFTINVVRASEYFMGIARRIIGIAQSVYEARSPGNLYVDKNTFSRFR